MIFCYAVFKSCYPHQTSQIRTYHDRFLLLAKGSDLCFILMESDRQISCLQNNPSIKAKKPYHMLNMYVLNAYYI